MANQLELLAPAKDLECGLAAINCGADSVYLGAEKFGARNKTGNSLADIATLVTYAHKYWARVYVAVNTLLYDEELKDAVTLIKDLYNIGVDAVIIQDYGLLAQALPPIPLFASTQLNNRTAEKVLFLEQAGLQRVILARELSCSEIKEIRAKTSVALECFVHGALCVAYSGQCYLSYALGGRSGNRGNCAQPCRKKYSLYDENNQLLAKDQHLLSLKDLNLSGHLRELADAGITSFKIEGRLKDVGYVKNVVSFYRQELDKIIDNKKYLKASSGSAKISFKPNLAKSFNRGFTEYFFNGRHKEIKSLNTPKSLGEYLGKVTEIAGPRFKLDQKTELHNGDGLCYVDNQEQMTGGFVNETTNGFIKLSENPQQIMPSVGNAVFRNYDLAFAKQLQISAPARKIKIEMTFTETANGFFLKAQDEDKLIATEKITCEKLLAQKPEQATTQIKEHLSRLGESDFEATSIFLDLKADYFIPPKILNQLRRSLTEQLAAERLKHYPQLKKSTPIEPNPFPEKELYFNSNLLNKAAAEYLKKQGAEIIEPAAESGLDLHGKKIFTSKYCLKYELGLCTPENKNKSFYLKNEQNDLLELKTNCQQCEMELYLK